MQKKKASCISDNNNFQYNINIGQGQGQGLYKTHAASGLSGHMNWWFQQARARRPMGPGEKHQRDCCFRLVLI